MPIEISVKKAIYEENDARARAIHDSLKARGIFVVNVLGGPGAGKTSLISNLARLIRAEGGRVAVIEGDLASDIDTRKLRELGIEAFQIETGGDCHLNAAMIEAVILKMSLENDSWLFIENIGNLVCPAEFVIGEDLKLVVVGVTEGSDKPYKYPFIFAKSAACVLTKVDLKEAMAFDEAFFEAGLAAASPEIALLGLNGRTGEGAESILEWLASVRDRIGAVQ
jgi:hydrogenase nickel incorporation protein HypB